MASTTTVSFSSGREAALARAEAKPAAKKARAKVAARVKAIDSGGGNAFFDYQVPAAVITLKQGFGRLIRSLPTRKGVTTALDLGANVNCTAEHLVQFAHMGAAYEALDAETKAALGEGTVDIVVGTHALLGKSIKFRDLGLLVVDEEPAPNSWDRFTIHFEDGGKQRNDVAGKVAEPQKNSDAKKAGDDAFVVLDRLPAPDPSPLIPSRKGRGRFVSCP